MSEVTTYEYMSLVKDFAAAALPAIISHQMKKEDPDYVIPAEAIDDMVDASFAIAEGMAQRYLDIKHIEDKKK